MYYNNHGFKWNTSLYVWIPGHMTAFVHYYWRLPKLTSLPCLFKTGLLVNKCKLHSCLIMHAFVWFSCKTRLNMSEHVWTYLNMSEHVWTCLKMSLYRPDLSKIGDILIITALSGFFNQVWSCLNMSNHVWQIVRSCLINCRSTNCAKFD
jgi:hypothetical protein